jgi:hypothetical protein
MKHHTPGPWKFTGENQNHDFDRSIISFTKIYKNPRAIARVYGGGVSAKPDDENIANARLIAAAPDLLFELEAIVEQLDSWFELGNSASEPPDTAEAKTLIAKARGESHE